MKSYTYYAVQILLQGKTGVRWGMHPLGAQMVSDLKDACALKNTLKKANYAARVIKVTTTRKVVSR